MSFAVVAFATTMAFSLGRALLVVMGETLGAVPMFPIFAPFATLGALGIPV